MDALWQDRIQTPLRSTDKLLIVRNETRYCGYVADLPGGVDGIEDVPGLQAALDAKADSAHSHDYAATSHTHAVSDTTGLQAALDGKASSSHTHAISDSTGLQTALDGKSSTSHNHDGTYATAGHNHDAAYAAIDHTHEGGSSWEFPVGYILISTVNTNPGTFIGYGTWSAFGAGRVMVGLDSGQTEFDTAEETGGAKTHALTTAEMPSHTHVQDAHTHVQDSHNHTQNAHTHVITSQTATTGGATSYEHGTLDTSSAEAEATEVTGSTTATNQAATATNQNATAVNQNAGGGGAHNNLQPYIVCYFWKRTA